MKRGTTRDLVYGKEIWEQIEEVTHVYSPNDVFNDWLDIIINAYLSLTDNMYRNNFLDKATKNKLDGIYEDRYMAIVKKYNDRNLSKGRPIDSFSAATGLLFKKSIEEQKDVLGEIYQVMITGGESEQYFTPESLTDMMNQIVMPAPGESVCDPCCGSGRMLLSAAKINPEVSIYGEDIDIRCVKMTVINMLIFNLNAAIDWGNSLSDVVWTRWVVKKGNFLYEIPGEEIKKQPEKEKTETPLMVKQDKKGQKIFSF